MPNPGMIITADDYGLNKHCSAGIRKAVELGVVSSVHVMTNLVDDEDMELLINAVRSSGNRCGIGLHLNTTWGKSLIQEPSAFKFEKSEGGNTLYWYKGIDTYRHSQVVEDEVQMQLMKRELNAQLDKLISYVGDVAHIDAISSHHNIHLWEPLFVDVLQEMSDNGDIPVRSPLRWESKGAQVPRPGKYPPGTDPLRRVAVENIVKAADQPSTLRLLSTVLHPQLLIDLRAQLVQTTDAPVNNSGHWFGQPTPEAIRWFMRELLTLNEETNNSGYTSEIYMHLADSDFGNNPGYDYKMWQRAAELTVINNDAFRHAFAAWKEEFPVRHGSYRELLQNRIITI